MAAAAAAASGAASGTASGAGAGAGASGHSQPQGTISCVLANLSGDCTKPDLRDEENKRETRASEQNAKPSNATKRFEVIKRYLDKDVLFFQELKGRLLTRITEETQNTHECKRPKNDDRTGGGTWIFLRKKRFKSIKNLEIRFTDSNDKTVEFMEERACFVKATDKETANVYLFVSCHGPVKHCASHSDLYRKLLVQCRDLKQRENVDHVIIGGDFNYSESNFIRNLPLMCEGTDMEWDVTTFSCEDISLRRRDKNIVDYFVSDKKLTRRYLKVVHVDCAGEVLDHDPVIVEYSSTATPLKPTTFPHIQQTIPLPQRQPFVPQRHHTVPRRHQTVPNIHPFVPQRQPTVTMPVPQRDPIVPQRPQSEPASDDSSASYDTASDGSFEEDDSDDSDARQPAKVKARDLYQSVQQHQMWSQHLFTPILKKLKSRKTGVADLKAADPFEFGHWLTSYKHLNEEFEPSDLMVVLAMICKDGLLVREKPQLVKKIVQAFSPGERHNMKGIQFRDQMVKRDVLKFQSSYELHAALSKRICGPILTQLRGKNRSRWQDVEPFVLGWWIASEDHLFDCFTKEELIIVLESLGREAKMWRSKDYLVNMVLDTMQRGGDAS